MSVSGIFKIFSKKNNPAVSAFLNQITESMDELVKKSATLSDGFSEEKKLILQIKNEINSISPDDNPTAKKFEYAILEKLTLTNSLCEKAITGKDSKDFKSSVLILKNIVNQRKNLAFEDEK